MNANMNEQQKDLAEAIGTTQAAISDIENGRRATSFDKLAAICMHYNVSADYLLGLIDDPKPLKMEKMEQKEGQP